MSSVDTKPENSKPSRRTFTLASRPSKLAQIQTNTVRDALQAAFPSLTFETSFISSEGDKNQSQALYLLGGKAFWTKELEVALKENMVDMLVHSFKDVPTLLPGGCEIGAILEREDPADSLVVKEGLSYRNLEELPEGSVVGTSSVRRVAQLRRNFPKIVFLDVRGNIDTRLAKLDAPNGPYSALILAKAGIVRLGLGHRITADIKAPILFHAVGQGALAVEIRSDDAEAQEICKALTHWQTQYRCLAERACLRVLEGGCSVPVGVNTSLESSKPGEAILTITGCVTSLTGESHVEHTLTQHITSTVEAEQVGVQLAKVLIETGAKTILEDVTKDREMRVGELKSSEETAKFEATMKGAT